MLRQRDTVNPLDTLRPVIGAARVRALVTWARGIHVAPAVEEYAVALVRATRQHPEIRLGASPRATLQLVRAAKVWAALDGREFVIPDDIGGLLEPVLAHRLLPVRGAAMSQDRSSETVATIIRQIAGAVRVPLAAR